MDATVFSGGRGVWQVNASPTMRSLGHLIMGRDRTVRVVPDERSSVLHGVNPGPYGSVEEAMAAIGIYLGGQCGHAGRVRRSVVRY
jgi:hypothetical protein